MLIAMRALIAGPALAAALALTPASTLRAAPGVAVRGGALDGVACPRAGHCWAVGSQRAHGLTRVLIEGWNGSRWRVAASPGAASKRTFLSGVSCTSTSSCWAVGAATVGTTTLEPIAEHWNGRKWSLTVLAEPAGGASAELFGVWCATAGRCWAVGAIDPGTRSGKPLTEHWTGRRWSVVRAAAAAGGVLNAVSCRRDTSCWAVGVRVGGALAERWNGKKWLLAATPSTGGGLISASCPGQECFAVGEDGFPGALAERWNGSKWSVMHTPQPAGEASSLFGGVSCVTSSDCFAVGHYYKSNIGATLIERLRGSKWVIVRSPNPAGAGLAGLNGVACTSARACWAVGEQEKTLFVTPSRTLAERWNGTRWSIVATP